MKIRKQTLTFTIYRPRIDPVKMTDYPRIPAAENPEKRHDAEASCKQVLFVQLPVTCKCPETYSPYRRRKRKCCDVAICVRVLWTGLSVIVTLSCCLAFVQPYWLTNVQKRSSFGLYSYCVQDNYVEAGTGYPEDRRTNGTGDRPPVSANAFRYVVHYKEKCSPYGQYFRLAHLPSNAWQIACVLFGGGCFLQGFGALASIVTSLMVDWWASRFAGYTGYIQTMGGE